MRYFFQIGYNGARYNGWQTQDNGLAVQTVVEDVLSKMFRQNIETVCSGRTDTGVHCERQFFHCDIDVPFSESDYVHKINSFLPKDIAIYSIHKVKEGMSARFDALERSYRYDITLVKNPLLQGLAWHYFKKLDILTMNRAASLLLGDHDYECFSKVKTDVTHFLCDVKYAEWKTDGDMLHFHITANRFLRGMVRAIVGTLLDVGTGKITIEEFQNIISSRDRRKAGANVPPYGLYLVNVKYPPGVFVN